MKFSDLSPAAQNVAQKFVAIYGAIVTSGPLLVVVNGVADGNTTIPNAFGTMTKEEIYWYIRRQLVDVEQDAAQARGRALLVALGVL